MIDDSLLQMSQASLEIAQNAIDMAKKASLFKEEAEEYIAKAKKDIDAELQKAKKRNAEAERRLSETSPLELTTYEAKEILSLLKELDGGCNIYLLETKIKQAINILEQKVPKQNIVTYANRI